MKVLSKVVVAAVFMMVGSHLSAQVVIKITKDTVFDETVVFNEDTILEGEGNPTVSFNGAPKFEIINCRVMIKNMTITEKENWGTIDGPNGCLEWTAIGMHGFIQKGVEDFEYMLDGITKRD